MEKKIKTEKGITLIALIITIIILVILAGVSLNALGGENGILTQARNAKINQEDKIGEKYLVPLLGAWDSFDEIDFNALPNQFALKCNHGSGMNLVVKDKGKMGIVQAKVQFDVWMKTNFAFVNGFELQYKDIPRKIIAEKYIEQFDRGLTDYKIHVFHGIPKIIQVIGNRDLQKHTAKECFLTVDWEAEELMYHTYDMYEEIPPKPEQFEEMLETARRLGEGFKYVRVDLYGLDGSIKFGEMTFTPASGFGKWGGVSQFSVGSWIKL